MGAQLWEETPDNLKSVVLDRLHQTKREMAKAVARARPTSIDRVKNELAAVDAAIAKLEGAS